ncbi:hypothetical protein Tco_1551940 [Tanacetum coccineum]
MDDEPMWAADHVLAPTPGSAITIPETANEFAIKGNHLTLVKGNQFDGSTKTDPYKHIHGFLGIWMNSTKELSKHRMNFELLSLAVSFPQLFSTDSSEKSELSLNMKTNL